MNASVSTAKNERGALTLGHLGLSSQARAASSSASWWRPSLRRAAERLLYRMQFCGSARRALVYRWTASWKSPRWHASLLCCTFSMNSALLRPHALPPSPDRRRAALAAVRELKTENWGDGEQGGESDTSNVVYHTLSGNVDDIADVSNACKCNDHFLTVILWLR